MTVEVNHQVVSVLHHRLNSEFTPDILKLTKYPFMIFMDYGTFMQGGYNSYFIEKCPRLGQATTLTEGYKMFDGSDRPVAFREKTRADAGMLRGEAFLVTLPELMKIDQLMYNTIKFQRQKIMITLDDQDSRKPSPFMVKGFVYLGIDHKWETKDLKLCRSFYEGRQKIYEW